MQKYNKYRMLKKKIPLMKFLKDKNTSSGLLIQVQKVRKAQRICDYSRSEKLEVFPKMVFSYSYFRFNYTF